MMLLTRYFPSIPCASKPSDNIKKSNVQRCAMIKGPLLNKSYAKLRQARCESSNSELLSTIKDVDMKSHSHCRA
eukprot:6400344-Amphidinium_carterae.1